MPDPDAQPTANPAAQTADTPPPRWPAGPRWTPTVILIAQTVLISLIMAAQAGTAIARPEGGVDNIQIGLTAFWIALPAVVLYTAWRIRRRLRRAHQWAVRRR